MKIVFLCKTVTLIRMKKIAYQGVEGAYTHQAARELFPDAQYISQATFEHALDEVAEGRADSVVMPFENSMAGRVANVHQLLSRSGLIIVGEYFMSIHHCLHGIKGSIFEDITDVYSLHQGLAQCGDFIKEHNLTEVQYSDTAGAVEYIVKKNDKTCAAIASKEASDVYGSVILKENIQTDDNNVTRFLILEREGSFVEQGDDENTITSLFYKTKNIPASVYKSLSGFATAGINVIKLESDVPMTKVSDASFYLEFVGHPESKTGKQALLELGYYASEVHILGVYKKHEFRKNFEE